jgi:hypothetical protein
MVVLILSGLTAFPLYTELKWALESDVFIEGSVIQQWLLYVFNGVKETQEKYPFMFYGFDWLAFAHFIIAILFIGVYQHPVRNRWIVQWAMISCICVLPLAFIAGSVRGIPFFHILIDCSFGIVGLVPLYIIQTRINELKKYRNRQKSSK